MTTALIWHEKLMWFDTGTFAGPMPVGGWVQPGEASENPEPSGVSRTCSMPPA